VLRPRRIADKSHQPFKDAYNVSRTKRASTDSEEPRVEIEKTSGLSR